MLVTFWALLPLLMHYCSLLVFTKRWLAFKRQENFGFFFSDQVSRFVISFAFTAFNILKVALPPCYDRDVWHVPYANYGAVVVLCDLISSWSLGTFKVCSKNFVTTSFKHFCNTRCNFKTTSRRGCIKCGKHYIQITHYSVQILKFD